MQLGLGLDWRVVRQFVLYPTRSAVARREKRAPCTVLCCTVPYTTAPYCTHLLWVAGCGGGTSPVKHPGKQSQYRMAPVVGPSQRAQPWNHRNSICTYGGTTDSCFVQYMHVCTSSRLTNGIVSSRYQIAYRGHSRQALVSNFLTFRPRFPRVNVSTPAAGPVICQLSVAAVGFSTPTRLSTF
jgi:hypothetical protein